MTGRYFPLAAAVAFGFLLPASANARNAYSYSYAYIRHIEGDFQIQRATELEPTEATINHPILAGDRVWTRAYARAEIQFGDGSILRMDERTRIDFADFGESGGETFLRQWSGSIFLRLSEEKAGSFRLDTPAGTIYPASAGLFRIDVYDGAASTVLSVYEGVAELASEAGSVLVRSGQRSIVEPGRRPEPSFAFNTTQWDEFAAWSDERDREYAYTEHIEGIPPDVEVYADHLHHYGTWHVDVSLGPVWYPSVSVGWYPYSHGSWTYTHYGWTWVSYEPWGWAPYHYGRWGYSHRGWYWIPGAYWGPAWVSWAIGPSWIGWCPLGYYDRPVFYHDGFHYRGGKAVPRGSVATRTRGEGWNFVRTEHFGGHSVAKARLRSADIRPTAHQAQVLESGAVLDRNLRPSVVGAAAMTRLPKEGIAALRNRTGPGEPATGGRVTTKSGHSEGGRGLDSSGQLQAGRARLRSQPSSRLSSQPRSTENRSELQQGSPLSSAARSRSGSRATPIDRVETPDGSSSQGGPRGSRGGAIQRLTPENSGSRSWNTFQPSGRTSDPSTPNRSNPELSRGSVNGNRPSRQQPQTSNQNRSTVRRRFPSPSSPSSRTNESPGTLERGESQLRSRVPSSPGGIETNRSRSRSLTSPSRSPNRITRPEPRSGGGSVRGRDIYSHITRRSPKATAPSRSQPSARPSQPRRPSMGAPSRPSSPPRSSSPGGARSTRGAKKKK